MAVKTFHSPTVGLGNNFTLFHDGDRLTSCTVRTSSAGIAMMTARIREISAMAVLLRLSKMTT